MSFRFSHNLTVRPVAAGLKFPTVFLIGLMVLVSCYEALASEAVAVQGFPTVVRRSVNIWSDGTRLAADLTYPKDIRKGQKLPAIVMCHGWGGTKASLNGVIAPWFAASGFVVLTFDYRGWGESDSRLVVKGKMPKPGRDGRVSVTAQAIRQLVDPLDQQEDIDNAISFIEGEPGVDPMRIGIWGSSFGGGHVIWRAAHDDRVKCVVSQVGSMDAAAGFKAYPGALRMVRQDRIDRARGKKDPVPQGVDQIQGLRGTPYNARMARFSPIEFTNKINVPVLLIDASKEHYFDIRQNSGRVYKDLKGRGVPVKYHVLDGITHYGVYSGEPLKLIMALEVPWFQKHLQAKK